MRQTGNIEGFEIRPQIPIQFSFSPSPLSFKTHSELNATYLFKLCSQLPLSTVGTGGNGLSWASIDIRENILIENDTKC